MRKDPPLLVGGLFFAIIALFHLARLYYQIPLVVGETEVPLLVTVIGFFIAFFLSLWMFLAVTSTKSR